mmetsp:Transcript_14371/g.19675  ORF Transcript_14371/g.19675 Transcript_14371/m.19675 type:complete len:208 (-) Transcript_14371:367-990(-)
MIVRLPVPLVAGEQLVAEHPEDQVVEGDGRDSLFMEVSGQGLVVAVLRGLQGRGVKGSGEAGSVHQHHEVSRLHCQALLYSSRPASLHTGRLDALQHLVLQGWCGPGAVRGQVHQGLNGLDVAVVGGGSQGRGRGQRGGGACEGGQPGPRRGTNMSAHRRDGRVTGSREAASSVWCPGKGRGGPGSPPLQTEPVALRGRQGQALLLL